MSALRVIACGALARELKALKQLNGWEQMQLHCLDAELHNHPQAIPERVRSAIQHYKTYAPQERLFVAYADCGTGGLLDQVLTEEGVERLPGAHCYAFYAGEAVFDALAAQEPGTFYLTDFLARHFDRLVIHGLQLDRYPQLKPQLFGNYRRLVYLSQTEDAQLVAAAQAAAVELGLTFEQHPTGYGDLARVLKQHYTQAASLTR